MDEFKDTNDPMPDSSILWETFSISLQKCYNFLLVDEENINSYEMSPIIQGIIAGHNDLIDTCVEENHDINEINSAGSTALMFASICRDHRNIRLLLKHGADINIVNKFGFTALYYTAYRGYISTMQLLLDHGADPNLIKPNQIMTPDACQLIKSIRDEKNRKYAKQAILNVLISKKQSFERFLINDIVKYM